MAQLIQCKQNNADEFYLLLLPAAGSEGSESEGCSLFVKKENRN